MEDNSDKAQALIDYCQGNQRICPKPDYWNRLYNILYGRKQNSSGSCEPGLPPILSAWWLTDETEKMKCLCEHIVWADEHGVIDKVDTYLRGLSEEQWFHAGD